MIETDGKNYIVKLANGTFAIVFTPQLAQVLDSLNPDEAYTHGAFLNIAKAVDERTLLYKVLPAIFNGELKLNILYSGWETYLKAMWKKKLGKKKFETLVCFIDWQEMAKEAELHSCLIPEVKNVYQTACGMLEVPERLNYLL